MAAESILSSKRKRAKANFTMLNSKIKVLEKYKDAYVEEHGEENYKKKLQELINALMASGEPDELPAPQMDKDDEDSDDNNDDHGSWYLFFLNNYVMCLHVKLIGKSLHVNQIYIFKLIGKSLHLKLIGNWFAICQMICQ